jgi:hypothetical protein
MIVCSRSKSPVNSYVRNRKLVIVFVSETKQKQNKCTDHVMVESGEGTKRKTKFFDQESNRFPVYANSSSCRKSAFCMLMSDDESAYKKITLASTMFKYSKRKSI